MTSIKTGVPRRPGYIANLKHFPLSEWRITDSAVKMFVRACVNAEPAIRQDRMATNRNQSGA